MKQLTCAQMGGPCQAMIGGNDWNEMMDNGMKHLEQAHPEMVDKMKNMSPEDNANWMAMGEANFNAAPNM